MTRSDPLPAYLNGWHPVFFSADVRRGAVLSRRAFGQEVNGGIYVWHRHRGEPPGYRMPAHPAFDRAAGSLPLRGSIQGRTAACP